MIRVADNGARMDADDLALSVERHATSKIPDGDLPPSRRSASAARRCRRSLGVAARNPQPRPGADAAFALAVEDGAKSALRPNPIPPARGSKRATCSPRRRRG